MRHIEFNDILDTFWVNIDTFKQGIEFKNYDEDIQIDIIKIGRLYYTDVKKIGTTDIIDQLTTSHKKEFVEFVGKYNLYFTWM